MILLFTDIQKISKQCQSRPKYLLFKTHFSLQLLVAITSTFELCAKYVVGAQLLLH